MAAILVFFCLIANWPFWPRSSLNILLNFTFESEVKRANSQGNKRILKWRPFWNKVHASLLFCPFRFIRFLLHATLLFFMLVVAFFVSRSFLFWPFLLLSPFTGLWVFFPLARFSSVLLRLRTPGFFVSFVSFAIVLFAFAFSARFVQSLAFFISGLCYFSWRSV